jgi:hypothetical protein
MRFMAVKKSETKKTTKKSTANPPPDDNKAMQALRLLAEAGYLEQSIHLAQELGLVNKAQHVEDGLMAAYAWGFTFRLPSE